MDDLEAVLKNRQDTEICAGYVTTKKEKCENKLNGNDVKMNEKSAQVDKDTVDNTGWRHTMNMVHILTNCSIFVH